MSLEQSIDRLSGLIEKLISQLEKEPVGKSTTASTRAAKQTEATVTAQTEPAKESPSEGEPSSGTTKSSGADASAPADTGASTGLDYKKDLAPRFSALVNKDRKEAIKLMRHYNKAAKNLEEGISVDGAHDQSRMRFILSEVELLLKD